ncbi:hypothetical protein NFI96_004640 [Prochilodus magdalenae]|nr:hypothetical protein NFI96_004640 [Prochilodus magdalenae]
MLGVRRTLLPSPGLNGGVNGGHVRVRHAHGHADVPRNFSVNLATKTSVLLTWEFPESSSPYRFTVEYNRQKMEVDARLRKAVIPNLLPDTSYDFKITSPEGNMGGLRHRIHAKTSPPIAIARPEIDHSRDTETTITIILPSLEIRSTVRGGTGVSMAPGTYQHLVESLPGRVAAVRAANGGYSGYQLVVIIM